jgi:hypothetical protein
VGAVEVADVDIREAEVADDELLVIVELGTVEDALLLTVETVDKDEVLEVELTVVEEELLLIVELAVDEEEGLLLTVELAADDEDAPLEVEVLIADEEVLLRTNELSLDEALEFARYDVDDGTLVNEDEASEETEDDTVDVAELGVLDDGTVELPLSVLELETAPSVPAGLEVTYDDAVTLLERLDVVELNVEGPD